MVLKFMLLIDSIIKNPKELTTLTNEDLANLGFCTSCIMASNFTSKYSQYYNWSTGAVVVSVGLYAFMKQLDNSYLLNSHFPAFIVLIHEGREYFANLIQELIQEFFSLFYLEFVSNSSHSFNIFSFLINKRISNYFR